MEQIQIWQRDINNEQFCQLTEDAQRIEERNLPAERASSFYTKNEYQKSVQLTQLLERLNSEPRGFEVRRRFPDLSHSTKVKKNEQVGRYIAATADLNVGRKVVRAKPFASAVNFTKMKYCLTCHKFGDGINFIVCERCENVVFCSLKCKRRNGTHRYECRTQFHSKHLANQTRIKCAIQMVLEAIHIFEGDIEKLQEFIENVIEQRNNNNNQIPDHVNDGLSRFECILNLYYSNNDVSWTEVTRAFDFIMKFPMVNEMFIQPNRQHLLQHCLAHNLAVIVKNAFNVKLGRAARTIIYDSFSLFNHSCSPNVINLLRGNVMIGYISHHVTRGDELCTSYLPMDYDLSPTIERQDFLEQYFGFRCECVRCSTKPDITEADVNAVKDLSFDELIRRLNEKTWTVQLGATILSYKRHLVQLLQQNLLK